MSSNTSVGNISVEGAGDQRNKSEEEKKDELPPKFDEGQENAHQAHDSSEPYNSPGSYITDHIDVPTEDQRSIANRLAAAEDQNDDSSGKKKTAEQIAGEIDPTAPARMHGNEPSRGAKIDKKIEDEEAEIIRKMDEKKAQKTGK